MRSDESKFNKKVKAHHRREGDYSYIAITYEQWKITLDFFDSKCAYCGNDSKLIMEHIVPVVLGGSCTFGNIIPACYGCNTKKKGRPARDFLESIGRDARERIIKFTSLHSETIVIRDVNHKTNREVETVDKRSTEEWMMDRVKELGWDKAKKGSKDHRAYVSICRWYAAHRPRPHRSK